tara:strand:- start:41 stop:313 length:273 start_codon:yes stop_codon:yes gene_type:complete
MKHKRTQKIIVRILDEEGELTTGEIYDRLVNFKSTSSKKLRKNTHLNVTMNALVNIMKRKTFVKIGMTSRKPKQFEYSRQVIWGVNDALD